MTRRGIAVAAWLVTVAMDALVAWAVLERGLLETMFASLPTEEQRVLEQGMFAVTYAAIAGFIAVTLAYATVGLLLASRRRGSRVGAILLAAGGSLAAVPFGYGVGGVLALRDPFDPAAGVLILVGSASSAIGFSLILPVVALTFPDGRLPSPSWRWPGGVALAALSASTILIVLRPGEITPGLSSRNPLGVDALPAWLTSLAAPLFGIGFVLVSVLGIVAVVTRYRRGSLLERQQLRWFVAAVLLAAVPITISPLQPGVGGPGWFVLAVFGLLLVPVSVWIAVTRYRLYEIDRLISRGVSWAVLSGLLVAVYVGAVLLFQSVLGGVTQSDTLAVAGSTLLAAALFQPLRRRVQAAMDRRFDRTRYDAQRTAAAFAGHLRDQIDLGALKGELRAVVGRSLAPTSVGIWLRASERTADR